MRLSSLSANNESPPPLQWWRRTYGEPELSHSSGSKDASLLFTTGWCKIKTGGELRLSPSPSANKAIPTMVSMEKWNSPWGNEIHSYLWGALYIKYQWSQNGNLYFYCYLRVIKCSTPFPCWSSARKNTVKKCLNKIRVLT